MADAKSGETDAWLGTGRVTNGEEEGADSWIGFVRVTGDEGRRAAGSEGRKKSDRGCAVLGNRRRNE